MRTAVAAGCRIVVLTNAAGGIHESYQVGQPVLIRDHLNLTGRSPLTGPPPPAGYPSRFTDLTDLYSARLRGLAREADPGLAEGVYAALPGPHYETPAEIRMLRGLGADLVGMSTALEAIAARHLGAEVLGISLVTNLAAGLTGQGLDHAEVIAAGGPRRAGWARCWPACCHGADETVAEMIPAELRGRADAWIADDPDERDRAELQALLDASTDDRPPALRPGRAGGPVRGTAGVRHRRPARRGGRRARTG